jgi:hypothetical protein
MGMIVGWDHGIRECGVGNVGFGDRGMGIVGFEGPGFTPWANERRPLRGLRRRETVRGDEMGIVKRMKKGGGGANSLDVRSCGISFLLTTDY